MELFEKIIWYLLEVLLFLVASYFIFYKAWLAELGKEVAKLSTAEELTRLQENVKKDFQEKMEAYKSQLNEELSMKIEPLKSELAKANITHQVQFSMLHQERTKVIVELYKKLVELHSAMVNWTASFQPVIENAEEEEAERGRRVNSALHNFKDFFLLNKLFLSRSLSTEIDKIFSEYWTKGYDFAYNRQMLRSPYNDPKSKREYFDSITRFSNELKSSLPQKIEEIENIFRRLLSVEDDKLG